MAFTSVTTTPGLGDNLVTTAYDLVVDKALRARPQYRMFVDKRPERPSHKGDTIRLQLMAYFTEANITAAKTALGEETDVTAVKMQPTTYVDLTPAEYGFAVTRTEYLDLTSLASVDPMIAVALADHQNRVIDEKIQDVLDAGTNVLYAGTGNAAVDDIAVTDTITSTDIRKAVTKLRAASVVPWVGGNYGVGIHPHVEHDLREEAGAGGWRLPQEYGATQERLNRGEVGQWEGCVFYSNPLTRQADNATTVAVYRSFFFGREALAEAVAKEPGTVISPQTDLLRRFHSIGWYGVLDWAIYRSAALVNVRSASSVSDL